MWINDLVANSTNCDTLTKIVATHDKGLQSLSMEQMQSFFYIIFFGLTLATMGFTIEILKSRKMRREGIRKTLNDVTLQVLYKIINLEKKLRIVILKEQNIRQF